MTMARDAHILLLPNR